MRRGSQRRVATERQPAEPSARARDTRCSAVEERGKENEREPPEPPGNVQFGAEQSTRTVLYSAQNTLRLRLLVTQTDTQLDTQTDRQTDKRWIYENIRDTRRVGARRIMLRKRDVFLREERSVADGS